MSLADATHLLLNRSDLPTDSVPGLVDELLDPSTADSIRADFLRALTDKGETADEIAAFVQAILPRAVDPTLRGTFHGRPLLDVCGTGGGGLNLFNVSTALMFILPACGVVVLKHGNRGLSKTSGSSDVLAALGVPIDHPPEHLPAILDRVGSAFLFAPRYHPSFKILGPVRQALGREGRRTIFNLLGPLLNPARPDAQLMGTFEPAFLPLFHQVLRQLGRQRFAVVCGLWHCGRAMGEVSPCGPTLTATNLEALREQPPRQPDPSFGPLEKLLIDSPEASAQRIVAILEGTDTGPARQLLIENAAWALIVAGVFSDLPTARDRVNTSLSDGSARAVLERARAS